METTNLFVNHAYNLISNDENYVFTHPEEFTRGYLTMYPITKEDAVMYLNEGYSLIIDEKVIVKYYCPAPTRNNKKLK